MQAYVLRAQMTSWLTLFTHTGLYPSHRAACAPSTSRPQYRCETWNEPAGQANIERLRETGLRDRAGMGSQATMSTDPRQDRKVDSLAGIRQSSSHGRVTHRDLRGQLASRVRALVLAEGEGNPAAGSHAGIRESTRRAGSVGHKKSAAPKNGALPA